MDDVDEPNSDEALTRAFQRGDKGAYEAIYDRYGATVRAVCRRMLPPDDAKEAAQEAFLRVYQSLGRLNGRYHLGPWIARIATNVCLDQIRARRRRPVETTAGEELVLVESGPREDIDPAALTMRAAHAGRVWRHVAALPPRYRDPLVMRDVDGYAYVDIGRALGLSQGQVKAHLHRARRGFRRAWLAGVAADRDTA